MTLVNPAHMTKSELISRYALPRTIEEIKLITEFEIPVRQMLEIGPVGANVFGKAGGFQVRIQGRVQESWIRSTIPFNGVKQ